MSSPSLHRPGVQALWEQQEEYYPRLLEVGGVERVSRTSWKISMPQFLIPASNEEEQSHCSVTSAPTAGAREENGAADDHSGHPLPASIKPTAVPCSLASAGCYPLFTPMLSLVLISVCVTGGKSGDGGDYNFDPQLSYRRSCPHQKCAELLVT